MSRKAFTLIELLVVIAIIGVLSSIVLASLNTAREKARDARRFSDLRQIQTALEQCFIKRGTYMQAEANMTDHCRRTHPGDENLHESWATTCSEFLPVFPQDPRFTGGSVQNYNLHVRPDGKTYVLTAYLESSSKAMSQAEVQARVTAAGITGWSACPEKNYVVSGGF